MRTKLFAVLLAVALLFTGCSGITQEEYDAVIAERDTAVSERDRALSDAEKAEKPHEKALSAAETERDELEARLAALEAEREELQEELEAALTASDDDDDDDALSSPLSDDYDGLLEDELAKWILNPADNPSVTHENGRFVYHEADDTYEISIWAEGLTAGTVAIFTYMDDGGAMWQEVIDMMVDIDKQLREEVWGVLGKDPVLTINLLDVTDKETVLLAVTNGEVTVDILND